MTARTGLRQATEQLEKLVHDIEAIARRSDFDRQRDLLAARRALADQLALLGTMDDALSTLDNPETRKRDYRALFSAMRGAVARHQARWSVAVIGEHADDYAASVIETNRTTDAFINWVRTYVPAKD